LNKEKVIQLISGVKTCNSCRHIFMEYRPQTVASLYILEVLCIIKKIQREYKTIFISMAIIQDAPLSYTPKVVIQFYIRKVL